MVRRFSENYRVFTERVIARQGTNPSVLKLVMVSFGIDPMTGRAAALAAAMDLSGLADRHRRDMIFSSILMSSNVLAEQRAGDGTWAAVIVMAAMFGIPASCAT